MTSVHTENALIDELVPVLFQCFGVIVLGYFAGRWRILSDSQAKGINSYVTKFALPSVFFRVMVNIDFSGVCWMFVLAVSLSKLIVFVIAMLLTLLLNRRSELGISAIVAMFVSQSNDVALAYPVLKSLYPDLASYIYLFAPAQLVVLNPFAYFFLEWDRFKELDAENQPLVSSNQNLTSQGLFLKNHSTVSSQKFRNRCRQMLQVLWNVINNPLFFMTVIGVLFNFILNHHLPVYIDGLIKIIAESFAATALFSLGYGMVDKMGRITQKEIYMLSAILITKLIIVPFLTRELVVQMMPSKSVNESIRYSSFAFLYGSAPTAPPVYLFAAEYQVIPVVIGVGLVLGTFLCGPLMFILAYLVRLYTVSTADYDRLLSRTVCGISWTSIACCIWTLTILCAGRKIFRVPNRFTACHLICVLLSCVGVVAGRFLNEQSKNLIISDSNSDMDVEKWNGDSKVFSTNWLHYIQFAIFFFGCTGARIWTALIALVILFERLRSLCFVLRYQSWIYITGFILPLLVTSILLLTSSGQQIQYIDPTFHYGTSQLIISLIVLVASAGITITSLVVFVRINTSSLEYFQITSNCCNSSTTVPQNLVNDRLLSSCDGSNQQSLAILNTDVQSIESPICPKADHCTTNNKPSCSYDSRLCIGCDLKQRSKCVRAIAQYDQNIHQSKIRNYSATTSTENEPTAACSSNTDEVKPPHHRHVVFLIILLVTMFFGICLCFWRIVQEAKSGIYLALEFLDGAFNFGQGIILFALFGLDGDLLIMPIKQFFVRVFKQIFGRFMGENHQIFNCNKKLDIQVLDIKVNQFVKFHLPSCSKSICDNISPDHCHNSFLQSTLENWLLVSGLTNSREETDIYVQCLEAGHIIKCVDTLSTENCDSSERLLTFSELAWILHSQQD